MAIGNVAGLSGITPGELSSRPQRAFDPGVEQTVPAVTQSQPQAAPALAEADTDSLPVNAPPGTDPELWSVLTSAERRFFAKMHDTGPLTYGPKTANTPPGLMRGARFDRTV